MSTTEQDISSILQSLQKTLLQKPHISSIEDINEGYCGMVAGNVYTKLGKPDEMKLCRAGEQSDFHYWIEYQGTFYDVERPEGVANWQDLPFFKRHPEVSSFEYELWVKQGY